MWRCPICETLNEDSLALCSNCPCKHPECASSSSDSAEQMVNVAEFFLQHGELGNAWNAYTRITQMHPDDYRGWFGLAMIDSDDFSKLTMQQAEEQRVLGSLETAVRIAPPQKRAALEAIQTDYRQRIALKKSRQEGNRGSVSRKKSALQKKEKDALLREFFLFVLGTMIPVLAAILLVCLNVGYDGVAGNPKAVYTDLSPWAFPLIWAGLCALSLRFWTYSKALVTGVWLHWITALCAYGSYYANRSAYPPWSNSAITNFYLDVFAALNDALPPAHLLDFAVWPWVLIELLGIVCLLIWMLKRRK